MRMITRLADALLGGLAPRGRAEAACIGEAQYYCQDHVSYFVDACGKTHRLGTC
ncbi:hypothetical protein AB0I28_26560 [Phytomonospora sp. NPDC050363]|uniref:hypothetical protein n=1 Tax=Phytomonospora sp. NPDC050363 TaxID=3155642 RepID=UPI0033D52C39